MPSCGNGNKAGKKLVKTLTKTDGFSATQSLLSASGGFGFVPPACKDIKSKAPPTVGKEADKNNSCKALSSLNPLSDVNPRKHLDSAGKSKSFYLIVHTIDYQIS